MTHPHGTVKVCPLGLCRTEEECPNAPCVPCMRRLGEHLIQEVQVLKRQAETAQKKGRRAAAAKLAVVVDSLTTAINQGLH